MVMGNAWPWGSLGQMLCSPAHGEMVMVSLSNTGMLSVSPPSSKYFKQTMNPNGYCHVNLAVFFTNRQAHRQLDRKTHADKQTDRYTSKWTDKLWK